MPLPAMQRLPVIDEWLRAVPSLRKRSAGRWAGPCPVCGGEDRFHVEVDAGGRVLWGCRGCLDGSGDRRTATRRILQAAFPDRHSSIEHAAVESVLAADIPVGGGKRQARAEAQPKAEAAAMARLAWAGAQRAEASPAGRYLAERHVWPGDDGLDGLMVPLPDSVGWLPRNRLPKGRSLPVMPPGAEGAVAFRYEGPDGGVRAVALETLDAQGRRQRPERWRRTVGTRDGAAFRCGIAGGSPLVVAEGELDALAASWLHGPEAECLALGGTAGLAGWRPDADDSRPVVVECDGDVPGVIAAIRAERRLQRMGRSVSVRWRGPGEGDAASELAAQVRSAGWAAVAGIK